MNKLYTLLIILIAAITFPCKAAQITWTGNGSNNSWHNAANWSPSTVPTATDTVTINTSFVEISAVAFARKVSVKSKLIILVNGTLSIQNGDLATIDGISTEERIENFGTIAISNGILGVSVGGFFLNRTTGNLSIINTTTGIVNRGSFRNFSGGNITIFNTSVYGIYNTSLFENNGKLDIDTSDLGFYNLFDFPNPATFENNGICKIFNTTSYGFVNEGSILNNFNKLNIYNNTGYSVNNVQKLISTVAYFSHLNNKPGALMLCAEGILNSEIIENEGFMGIASSTGWALRNTDVFINKDTLSISVNATEGISNSDTLINEVSGVILSDSVTTTLTPYAIYSSQYFSNAGKIDIDLANKAQGILIENSTNSRLINSGEIILSRSKTTGLKNEKKFEIMPGGALEIKLCFSGNGLQNSDTLINYGSIKIKDVQNATALFQNTLNDLFQNFGTVEICNQLAGAYSLQLVNGSLENKLGANIIIKNNLTTNSSVLNNQKILNYGTFTVEVPIGKKALLNQVAFPTAMILPELINYGTMTITSPDSIFGGILNKGIINNTDCATFINQMSISNETTGSFTNSGIFRQEGFGRIVNQGNFTNNGSFNSKNRIFEDVINNQNAISSHSFFHPLNDNITYPVSIENNSALLSIPITWHQNPTLTLAAGTYTSSSSSFLASASSPGPSVYFKVFRPTLACDLLVEIPINVTKPLCDKTVNSTFIGINSTWFIKRVWSTNKIPNFCTDVLIPTGMSGVILPNYYGVAHKIHIQSGAVFQTFPNAFLNVSNDN